MDSLTVKSIKTRSEYRGWRVEELPRDLRQVLDGEMCSERSISLPRISCGESGMLTLIAAWHASEAELLVRCRTEDTGKRDFYFNHEQAR